MNAAADSPKRVPRVSPLSHEGGRVRPGRKVLCSSECHWESLLLQTFEQPGCVDHFETFPSPDYLLVLSLEGEYEIESFSSGRWNKAMYRPGLGGVTSPLTRNRLRWHSSLTTTKVLRLFVPQAYFLEAGEEYRRGGSKSPLRLPDALQFADPTVFAVARSLAEQIGLGAPNLYAEAGGRFLAAHLLLTRREAADQTRRERQGGVIADARFRRVLEYTEQNFARDISLETLACEAGISPFHFTRLFKAKLGVTPHRHVVRLRMQHAKGLLQRTELPVAEIALKSGYTHGGHFAAAFKRETGLLPRQFREKTQCRR